MPGTNLTLNINYAIEVLLLPWQEDTNIIHTLQRSL